MKYADLHIHTNFSDGTFSPSQIIALAKKSGISCISITDHDSVKAYLPSLTNEDVEIIPGIELTADINNTEVHILGYFISTEEAWFQEKLKQICDIRIKRMEEMCKKLKALGIPLKVEEVLEFTGSAVVGRLHLARFMVNKGFVPNAQEAFNKYIGDGRRAYVSKFRLTPKEVIDLILKVKGIPVLAHPYSLVEQGLIPEFVQAGLMGLEAIYPEHSGGQTDYYQKLAKKYGLLITGGSDCHGHAKPEVGIGSIKVPYELIEKLKIAHRRMLSV